MRILVTGAAGFVGSRLAKKLLDRGDTVIGHDNMDPYYSLEHKYRHLRDLKTNKNFTFEQADLRDAPGLKKIVVDHKPDRIAHLGGMAAVRYSMAHPLIYGEINVQGSMNLLDAAAPYKIPCVLASTSSVYGTVTPVPFQETAAADRPLAAYPASKRAMELLAHTYHHIHELPVTIFRFFNVYGPHGRPDMMPWQWTLDILAGKPLTLYNAGKMKRDWTYIDDIVAGFTAALDKPNLGPNNTPAYEILNLGCGNPVENLTFVDTLEKILNKKATRIDTPTPPTEPLITYADTTKAKRLLGYEPKVQAEQGLTNFIHWLKEEKIIG